MESSMCKLLLAALIGTVAVCPIAQATDCIKDPVACEKIFSQWRQIDQEREASWWGESCDKDPNCRYVREVRRQRGQISGSNQHRWCQSVSAGSISAYADCIRHSSPFGGPSSLPR